MRSLAGLIILVPAIAIAKPGTAIQARDVMVMSKPAARGTGPANATVPHTLFLNNCRATNGCSIPYGTPDSTTNTSDLHGCEANDPGTSQITALTASVNWNTVMTCVQTLMAPYNIQVTDVDPGSAPHFEVIVAGNSSDLSCPTGVLGIADVPCQDIGNCDAYIPNGLVFDFANSAVSQFGLDESYICGVAGQEIAHDWGLDHVTLANDPMTYKQYQSPLSYHNAAPCGSDCMNGKSPFGLTCTGSGMNATHECLLGGSTQDEVTVITNLFGTGAPPPTVAITAPANNASEGVGKAFPVTATCTAPSGDTVAQIALSIDGSSISTTASSPASFMAPANLSLGNHSIDVNCSTTKGGFADATSTVVLMDSCQQDSDCKTAGDICYQQVCIAGPTSSGGLGDPCTTNSDCTSGQCGNDGTTSQCVVPCDTSNDQCPSGFGCLGTGTTGTAGVCWAGADNSSGGGCCDTGSDGRGSILLGLSLAGVLMLWKRPKRARA